MGLQFTFEFGEIVNLSVENHPNGFLLVRHRLMAAGKVDDREPAESETQRARDEIAFIIRTSMRDGFRHRLDIRTPHRRRAAEIKLSTYAAHEMLATL